MSLVASLATWRLDKNKVTSSEKLFLLMCANRSDQDDSCWPSIRRIVLDTSLERKTVIKVRQDLIKKGLLEYTGQYKGHAHQVPVMRLTYVKEFDKLIGNKDDIDDDSEDTDTDTNFDTGKSTDSNIGLGTDSKNGTPPCTKNGTQKLTVETNKETNYSADLKKSATLREEDDNFLIGNEKSDYKANHSDSKEIEQQVIESKVESNKSDYFENNTNKNKSNCSTILSLKDLKNDNPHSLPEKLLQDWLYVRKAKRSPVTESAWERVKSNLDKLKAAGLDPIDCFDRAVANGWIGIEYRYFERDIAPLKHSGKENQKPIWLREKEEQIKRANERELRAQFERRQELSAAKNFKSMVVTAIQQPTLTDRLFKAEEQRLSLGMSKEQYHHHVVTGCR